MKTANKIIPGLLICILFVSLCACGGAGQGNGEVTNIKNYDYFIIATTSDIVTLDPAFAYDTASAGQLENIYETLITYAADSTSEFLPCLATEWQISDGGLTYRFKIRKDVYFHNGNPLTPEDVEYSFERGMVHDYSLGPQWMFFEPLFGLGIYSSRTNDGLIPLDEIKNKVEVDGDWVQFNLANSYEPFMQILASSWGSIVDKDWCVANGDWTGTQESYFALNNPPPGGSPVNSITNGTGPFMLDYWQVATEIALVRNDNYWGEPAHFRGVVTKIVEEWSLRKLMFELGDVDCAVVPFVSYEEMSSIDEITAYDNLPTLLNQAFFFQFDIDPSSTLVGSGRLDGDGIPHDFFSDSNVRKGFAYAFDWDTYITEGMSGYGQEIASPIVEGVPYFQQDWPKYDLDLEKAENYLRQAWGGDLWEKGFELTLVYSAGDISGEIACEILQNNLFTINPLFKVNIQLMGWPNMLDNMVYGRLPMYLNGWTADYPDPHNFVFPYMHSSGTFAQWQRYSNQVVDDLIEEAVASVDKSERQLLYNQLVQLYYEEIPSIILSQNIAVYFFRDWIQGFVFNPIRPSYETYSYYLSKGY
ncbi:MAG: ABC transporter substrate-binding protein [Dehalococcoidia bacterium]|nr:MAG: ABC transporter substrate-binding protein [Dehalococcoidia bacterium]